MQHEKQSRLTKLREFRYNDCNGVCSRNNTNKIKNQLFEKQLYAF